MNVRMRVLAGVLVMGASVVGCAGSSTSFGSHDRLPAVPELSQPPFSVTSTSDVAPAMKLPSAHGFGGTVSFPKNAIQQYAQVTQTLQNVALSSSAGRSLVYYGLLFDAQLRGTLQLTLQVPQPLSGSSRYYLALYDPQRSWLGWQRDFSGPASLQTTKTLAFPGASQTFNRYEQYWLAVYALPASAPAPTPAPSVAPTVSPTPLPATIDGIQAKLSQTDSCSGTPCATGPTYPPQPPGIYTVTTGVTSPSLDGNSTQLMVFPSQSNPSDVLYYTPPLVSAPLATNAQWSFWYRIDQPVWESGHPTVMNALEFDFNSAMPNYSYNFSSQCVLSNNVGTPKNPVWKPIWQIWAGTHWTPAGFGCNVNNFTPNRWHHLTWTYSWNPLTLQTTYGTLSIDQSHWTVAPKYATHMVQPRNQTTAFLEVQYQQDMRPGDPAVAGPFKEWIDEATLTYW